MIKQHQCECEYCLFPWGKGAPVCARVFFQTKNRKDLMQCVEKGCKYYKKLNIGGTKK